MSVLQKAPSPSSPVNDAERYARLADSIGSAISGSPDEAPEKIVEGLVAFTAVSTGFFEIRRFQGKAIWRAPVTKAIDAFVAAPSESRAKSSAQLLPESPYEDAWFFETAVCFLVRATLDVAANTPEQANADARLAAERAERAFSVFACEPVDARELLDGMPKTHNEYFESGYITGTLLWSSYKNMLAAPALTHAQRPYVQSFGLLRIATATVSELVAHWPRELSDKER